MGVHQPRPSLSRLRPSHRTRTTSSTSNQQAHHAAPWGRRISPACGSCRRPLLSDEKQGVAKSDQTRKTNEYRSMEGVATPRRAPHPPGPQAPDPQFRSRGIAKAGPGGRGWATGLNQPQPSLVQLNAIATNQKHSTRIIHKQTTPAQGGGGMGLGAGGWGLGPRAGGGPRTTQAGQGAGQVAGH